MNAREKTNAPDETLRVALDGGATLFVEESHALPIVSIVVALRSGSAFDPMGKEGLARITGRMLRRGCEGMAATVIEDALDRLGGEMSIELSASSLAIHGQVIGRNLEAFAHLLTKVLGTPVFPEDEFSRLKRETSAEIVEARDSDRSLAQHFFRRTLFPGHPYGRSSLGTVASIEAIAREDVQAFYAQHFAQANIVVGFAGDVTPAQATALASRFLSRLPTGVRIQDPVPPPPPVRGRHLVLVNKPERTQTQIMIGTLGTSPHDDDHVPLGVANAIFGGTFTSRLMKAIRSERGWSYGAYARLAIDRQRQGFSLWTFPSATDSAPCVALELELLGAWIRQGVTEEEVAFIRRYLIRSQAFEVDTAQKRLHQAVDVEVLDLPADYHTGYAAKVAEVTVKDANLAVQRRISQDDLILVVVGTADEIRAPLEAVIPGLADVTVSEFDDEGTPAS